MPQLRRPYGTWSSPLSPAALAGALRLNDVQWDTDGQTLVWHEGRGARGALVAQVGADAPRDLTDADMSVRALVGYGGGDFTVAGGQVVFAGPGGRLYRQALAGGSARAITPAFGEAAAPRISPDGRWVAFIHTYEHADVVAVVAADGATWPVKLAGGTDFVMQPAWHPQGTQLAFVAWDHPNMPWDGTELRLATLSYADDRPPRAVSVETVAGGATTAIFQPEFSPDGRYLAYISDADGWNRLYLLDLQTRAVTLLTPDAADHGMPAWGQGMRTFGWSGDGRFIYVIRHERGFCSLWRCAVAGRRLERIAAFDDYTDLKQVAVASSGARVAVIASSARQPGRVVSLDIDEPGHPPVISLPTASGEPPSIQVLAGQPALRIHRRADTENVPPSELAPVEAITWRGHDGEDAHGLYYAPFNPQFTGVGAPPLVVLVHGGPTAQEQAGYRPTAQFFATRGYGVLLVNYRGSTGYGRAYMDKLRGSWGIYDVEDSATGAAYLASQGRADPSRFIIMGGSAGGFTVLQSLVVKPGFYRAGICSFGISNQFALAADTHKFEERYLDSMLGPLPEAAAVYRERSPLFHAERIVDPLAVFQGEDDKVVPRDQSDSIVASLKARGVPHIYHVYPGEGHGWRKPETIEHFYNAILGFLKQYVLYA